MCSAPEECSALLPHGCGGLDRPPQSTTSSRTGRRTMARAPAPGVVGGQTHPREAVRQPLDQQTRFQAGQRCAQAGVDAVPERRQGRLPRLAVDRESCRVGAPGVLVQVRRLEAEDDPASGRHRAAGELAVRRGGAQHVLQGRVVAQRLLDRARDERAVVDDPLPAIPVDEQLVEQVGDEASGGVGGREDQLDAVHDDLDRFERGLVGPRMHQPVEDARPRGRGGSPGGDQFPEVSRPGPPSPASPTRPGGSGR